MMFCIYHSNEWDLLVESGWTTWTVNEIDGVQLACMRRRGP